MGFPLGNLMCPWEAGKMVVMGTHQPEPLEFIAVIVLLKLFRVCVTDVAWTAGIHTGFFIKLAANTKILEI